MSTMHDANRQTISASDFGLGSTASNSVVNVERFQAFLNAAAGGIAFLPSGIYHLDSARLAMTGLVIPAGTIVRGESWPKSKIVLTGSEDCNLFMITDRSAVTIDGLWCCGNNVASGNGPGHAVYIHQTPAASEVMSDITIQNCRFENFKGDSWIEHYNESPSWASFRVKVLKNLFVSKPGNARNPAVTFVLSSCIAFSAGSTTAKIYDCEVSYNTGYCDHVKNLVVTYDGVVRMNIHRNEANNAGTDAVFSDDTACYAFMSYSGHSDINRTKQISYKGNRVFGYRDAAIYIVAVDLLEIEDFYFEGGLSTADATLPKGGIALNGAMRADVSNVTAGRDNVFGLSLAGGYGGEVWTFSNINLGNACQQPIKIGSLGRMTQIKMDGVIAHATKGRGLSITVTESSGIDHLDLVNFDISGTAVAAIGVSTTGTPTFKQWRIANGKIGNFGISAPSLASTTSPFIIENVTFDATLPENAISLDVRNSKAIHLKNLHFVGSPKLYHISANGTEGILLNITFSGVAAGHLFEGSSTFGRRPPTWRGTQGDFVQNIDPQTGTVATGAKYVLFGWRCRGGTTWEVAHTYLNDIGDESSLIPLFDAQRSRDA